jgi:hypothetical protein
MTMPTGRAEETPFSEPGVPDIQEDTEEENGVEEWTASTHERPSYDGIAFLISLLAVFVCALGIEPIFQKQRAGSPERQIQRCHWRILFYRSIRCGRRRNPRRCHPDLLGALRALMLANEHLERRL